MSESIEKLFQLIVAATDSGTGLSRTITDVQKTLGKGADIPKPPFDAKKVSNALAQSKKALESQTAELRKLRLQMQNSYAAALNDLVDYQKQIAASDFGLDANDPASAKKAAQVHKVFEAYFAKKLGDVRRGQKSLDAMLDQVIQ